jgi:hypothetical protein
MVPLDVTISAVYRLAGSMHRGGGPSNFCCFGLDPSAAGQGLDTGCLLEAEVVTNLWGSRERRMSLRTR